MIASFSMLQALDVWSDLWQAFYGDNGYGGTTAEIYAFRLLPCCPTLYINPCSLREEAEQEMAQLASLSLAQLLTAFVDQTGTRVWLMETRDRGVEFKPGDKIAPEFHRWHVRVERTEEGL